MYMYYFLINVKISIVLGSGVRLLDSTVHGLMAHVSSMLKPDCIFHSIPLRAFKHGFVYKKREETERIRRLI